MYLQEIFEVVIGLVFIWLVLSTATMQVGEWISNLLKWRLNERALPQHKARRSGLMCWSRSSTSAGQVSGRPETAED